MRVTRVTLTHPRVRAPRVCFESLEPRQLLSFDPSPAEQEMLELINRMRANPAAELDLLLNAEDTDINTALDNYDVSLSVLRQQWAELSPAAPLAWNELLYLAATGHTQSLIDADEQSHQLPGGPSLRDRLDAVGYAGGAAENVFSYAKSVLHAHAAFAIDWGSDMWGIQDPAGHRQNIMGTTPGLTQPVREVGLSVLPTPEGTRQTGPLVITQDFGAPADGEAFLLGTVRTELNDDGFYNAGEGLGGLTITITGAAGAFTTTTLAAGAYQLRVPAGVYTITLTGGSLSADNILVGTDNVKQDFLVPTIPTDPIPDPDPDADPDPIPDPEPDPVPPPVVVPPADVAVPLAKLAAKNVVRAGKVYGFTVTYTDDQRINLATVGKGDVLVYRNARFKPAANLFKRMMSADGRTVTAVYRIVPPGGSWDAADNGRYRVKLLPGHVLDQAGNAVAAQTMGTFTVKLVSKARKAVKVRKPAMARAVLASAPKPASQFVAQSLFSAARILGASPADEILRAT